MSTISDIVAADLKAIFADAGDTITYTTAAGVESSILAILPPWVRSYEEEESATHDAAGCEILIRTDATAGIAAPDIGDTVTISAGTWTVEAIVGQTHSTGTARLQIARQHRRRQGTPGTRMDVPTTSAGSASNAREGR